MSEWRDQFRGMAKNAREQARERNNNRAPRWDLKGKYAIVEPGASVIIRVLPRWDYALSILPNGKPNPKYEEGLFLLYAIDHWWDGPDGKPTRAWCPKSRNQAAKCPIHEDYDRLKASSAEEDQTLAKRIMPNDQYLINAMVGGTGKRRMDDQGRPDIRPMSLMPTLFGRMEVLMFGSEDDPADSFARGDIFSPEEGYDLRLTRPAEGGGQRWAMDAAPKPSPLFLPQEADKFEGWADRLVDLEALLDDEMETYEALYERYFGTKPEKVSTTMKGQEWDGDEKQARPGVRR